MRLALFLYFFCLTANASTCMISEEQRNKWNNEYSSLFKVNKEHNQDSYSVTISIPSRIEEKLFDNASIFKNSLEDPSFFFPLKAFKDEGKTKVWFVVKPDAKDVFYLSFDYGEDCGISVTLPVEFH